MTVLIAYGTIEGQSKKISDFIEGKIKELGQAVRVFDTSDRTAVVEFDDIKSVILVASVHERRHPKDFEIFLQANQKDIGRLSTLFLSVSLNAAFPESMEEAQAYADEMKMRTNLEPTAEMLIAGAVQKESYDYYATQILNHVVLRGRSIDPAVQEHEFTDWDRLEEGVTAFLK